MARVPQRNRAKAIRRRHISGTARNVQRRIGSHARAGSAIAGSALGSRAAAGFLCAASWNALKAQGPTSIWNVFIHRIRRFGRRIAVASMALAIAPGRLLGDVGTDGGAGFGRCPAAIHPSPGRTSRAWQSARRACRHPGCRTAIRSWSTWLPTGSSKHDGCRWNGRPGMNPAYSDSHCLLVFLAGAASRRAFDAPRVASATASRAGDRPAIDPGQSRGGDQPLPHPARSDGAQAAEAGAGAG